MRGRRGKVEGSHDDGNGHGNDHDDDDNVVTPAASALALDGKLIHASVPLRA